MKPEEEARLTIDDLLVKAGWIIQDYRNLDLSSSLGVVIRNFPLSTGEADYVIFVDRQPVGIIEAKQKGTTLSGVSEQSMKYITGLLETFTQAKKPPVFTYESTGTEIYFRDLRDLFSRSRRVFSFHQPTTLQKWFSEPESLRNKLKKLPPLNIEGLRDCQTEAITSLERSFADNRPRALIQMATGSGKTYMAVSTVYRLIKFANAKRILFLVDRNNLGRQARTAFEQYITPDDGRKLSELYNMQHLKSNTFDPVSRVCITTIQRLYSMLKGEEELEEEIEERSLFGMDLDQQEKTVSYNPKIPIEAFDFIITDECHRSIYNLWRQVLEYFDAFIIGLTATPSKQTLGFFHQNLVSEYNHERAVADGVNVGYEVYRIKTRITEEGSKVEAGYYVDKRDKLTRQICWEQLDTDMEYASKDLDRSVVSINQIRTIVKEFKDALFTSLFPGRKEVPKTLVFAKDDSHAEDITQIIREEFGKGNEFCKKITYRTTGEKPEDLIASFRNSYNPRVAVTVDMISTGTDIKPIECILFMRDVKSRVYFEQMKGRGTRTISDTDLKSVTPDAPFKTHFIIVDAVGVCENDKTDSRPLERKRGVSFEKLMMSIAFGSRDEDEISSLAGRIARLDKKLEIDEKEEIKRASGGKSLRDITHILLDSIDPDKHIEKAKKMFNTDEPGHKEIKQAAKELVDESCKIFDNPVFRNRLIEIKQRSEQTIDIVSPDQVISSGFDKTKAEKIVTTFMEFIESNKNELDALEIIYSKPYSKRHLTFEQIKQLAEKIKKPPYNLNQEELWKAYEQLEKSKVRGAGPQKLLTNIISLVRFATKLSDTLEPFPEVVERNFREWLEEQKKIGVNYTSEQLEWFEMIKNHIAASVSIDIEDFNYAPFFEKGGVVKVNLLFGGKIEKILKEFNEVLISG